MTTTNDDYRMTLDEMTQAVSDELAERGSAVPAECLPELRAFVAEGLREAADATVDDIADDWEHERQRERLARPDEHKQSLGDAWYEEADKC